ncbi:hypothetical protein [Streptomyces sp. N2A]|uniref:hypothetical protein n=1 Tax=Streptomyces sp. N2A TaxID=3073936 RepID=UPI00286FB570|nr:hypothetical protein [Streptomyces sp. N2A]
MKKATPESIRAEEDRKLANIRGRRDLSAEARQVAIYRIHQDAEQKMAAVQQADTEHYHRQRNFLERKLLGSTTDVTGTNALSSRDARERAAKYETPQDAADAFNRAQRDGDSDMQRAIAARAAELSSHPTAPPAWGHIVRHYASTTAGKQDVYDELASMREPGIGLDFTYVLPKPSELGRLTTAQLSQLADSDLTVYGDGPQAA